jgi:hypothetical protein
VPSGRSESMRAPSRPPPGLRRRLHLHLYDESGATPAGIAIYSLADPREVRVSPMRPPGG